MSPSSNFSLFSPLTPEALLVPSPSPHAEPRHATRDPTDLTSWSASTALCGTVEVVTGSPIVTTTCDLTKEISTGEGIRIGTFETTVTLPRDERTLTLNDPYEGTPGAHMKAYKIDLVAAYMEGYAVLPGCVDPLHGSAVLRTSLDLSRFVGRGDALRIRNFEFTVAATPTNEFLILSRPFNFRSSTCERIYKKIRPWDGGLTALACCVAMTQGSGLVTTTADLRGALRAGDQVRIRTETFLVEGDPTETSFRVVPASRLPPASMLRVFKQGNCTELSGVVGLVRGLSLVTTSHDLRDELQIGDTVQLGFEQYEVVAAPEPMGFVINKEWPDPSMSGIKALKCLMPEQDVEGGGSAIPLSVSANLRAKSSRATLTMPVGPDPISAGDSVRLCGFDFTIEAMRDDPRATILMLNRPWTGTDGATCRIWKLPVSSRQEVLQQLAQRKLKCLSIYCLAKIEEEERMISYNLDRSLTRLPGDQWTALRGEDSMADLVANESALPALASNDTREDGRAPLPPAPGEAQGAGSGVAAEAGPVAHAYHSKRPSDDAAAEEEHEDAASEEMVVTSQDVRLAGAGLSPRRAESPVRTVNDAIELKRKMESVVVSDEERELLLAGNASEESEEFKSFLRAGGVRNETLQRVDAVAEETRVD